ncbi:hypothetical protein QW060_18940 [Myroides ceti]|uniref:Uncharacterized protein n=1 Tax=Paenimyroides ceti TaxID=395087 RepID=A0ABT8CXA6_9FLAO|nr:hypothetical protein [Paenimyroides ceti]MDN3709127.1 hypothetical protein [Paenimyroides ceti]
MSKPNSRNTIMFYPTISPGQSVDYFWMASGGSTVTERLQQQVLTKLIFQACLQTKLLP